MANVIGKIGAGASPSPDVFGLVRNFAGNFWGYVCDVLVEIEGSGANREVREGPGIRFLQFWSKSDGGTPTTRQ